VTWLRRGFSAPRVDLSAGAGAVGTEHRRAFYASFGYAPEQVVGAKQVHGAGVARVAAKDGGRGALGRGDAIPGVDALITDTPGIALVMFFADCLPIMLIDEPHRAIGLAHAGWRGTIADVAGNTVRAMAEAFGTDPADLRVDLGPAIGGCCYEVGPEVAERFRAIDPAAVAEQSPRDHVDLVAANRSLLQRRGVLASAIHGTGLCTACRVDTWFSHRAERGNAGRFGAIIGL